MNDTICTKTPVAAYVHIPFCRSKCYYCDFDSYPGQDQLFDAYVKALISEITRSKPSGTPLRSVYVGGGTPTLLQPSALIEILDAIKSTFDLAEDPEITVEANPGTIDVLRLVELIRGGYNRLSIGVQSLSDDELAAIGRIHTAEEACDAVEAGRQAGFTNIGIDLMYALPKQSLDNWKKTLTSALSLEPEHISLYELSVEDGTLFGCMRDEGGIELPDENTQIEMYLTAINTLTSAGFEHYEISNFARPARRSRHNQVYWRNESYYGFGAGAAGFIDGTRYANLRKTLLYIAEIEDDHSPRESSETLSKRQSMGETVMLALRMLEGLDIPEFKSRFGSDPRDIYRNELRELLSRGLIEVNDERLRLTRNGLLLANDVMAMFLQSD